MATRGIPLQPEVRKLEVVKAVATTPQFITSMALALMTVSSVASLRAAPTMAGYGLASVFLYLVPAVVFLLPTAFVSAELASGWSGGVYRWVSEGVSPRWGFLAIWCQFAMTITYYPSLLAYCASTLAYVFAPSLASNGLYTAVVIISLYWLGFLVSIRGGITGLAKLASSGVVIGTLVPTAVLVVLGVVFLAQGNPAAAQMSADHLMPPWLGIASIVMIVNNFLSYSGMEMNAVHVSSLREPGREFPRAMTVASVLVVLIFVLPALAISWVIPSSQLSLTAGVMQAFEAFFIHFGVPLLTPVFGVMLLCASLSGFLTWLAGPSKGLLLIGRREGYLPPRLQQMNKHGVQRNILLAQGGITTIIGLLYAFVPAVSNAYWIFSVMTTQVYLIMYLLMFVSASRLRKRQPDVKRGYRAPALTLQCVVGFLASAAAIVIGFVPPSQFGGGDGLRYVLVILVGVVGFGLLAPALFLLLRKPSWKSTAPVEEVS